MREGSVDGQRIDSSKAKIGDFDDMIIRHKDVLGFEVSVDNAFRMTIINPTDELIHEKLDFDLRKGFFF
jgi:hypothetical protein